MTAAVVWHRADLRVADNPALAAAATASERSAGDTSTDGDVDDPPSTAPVFVVDPAFFADGLACDARLEFLLESLVDLDDQYRDRGSALAVGVGDPVDVLPAAANAFDATVHWNHHTTARYGRDRDRRVRDALGDRAIAHDADAIRRDVDDPRDGWSDHAEAYMTADPVEPPDAFDSNPLLERPVPSDTGSFHPATDPILDRIRDRFDVEPEKPDVQRGGRTPAVRRLDHFVGALEDYPGRISSPSASRTGTSRLSPYLALGCLSVREVYQAVQRSPHDRGRDMFTDRLYWNQHFRQKLEDWPAATDRAINPVMRGLHRSRHDPDLVDAWRRGETGYPLVDASMRCLVETGHLNFRMRALVATFHCHVLQEWWKPGADFMYYHLLDADAGINYEQWQMQANLTGVHPVRVYDPAKNQREHDPDGAFVRAHVPELRPVPDASLAEPWTMSRAEQADCGVHLGDDYPRPVVDFDHRASDTRDRYARLADRARDALEAPEIRRRASLSRRHETVDDDPDTTSRQTSLGDF
jgi:deoxyribodipyrimidine photo-lyase